MAPPPALRKACGFRDAVTELWPFCAGPAGSADRRKCWSVTVARDGEVGALIATWSYSPPNTGRARQKLPPKPLCGTEVRPTKSLDDALDRTGLAFSPGSHTIPCKRGTYS